ncbi:aminotransferase class I/II-fold pyridoxal phosphate-dependent enzyme [Peptacetobacter sp.]|uniref:aminotransferase class I/II-fold pyridoxal phosphate-dependent enzyme n=1 Tax=Peptacetobacter sp. TaxID=2991975 RepID=UPI00260E3C41|nr:aminotransferase class I/II-fold pyridoxal phosphate-dependent enzyme [Peptacetobacter sp.]
MKKNITKNKIKENEEKLYINSGLSRIIDDEIVSFHMPGHKNGKLYEKLGYKEKMEKLYKTDTTEIPGTDNLHSPNDIIKESLQKTEAIFDSGKTYYLINGSTCGIQTAIMSTCNPEDKLIMSRDSHQSAINGCILGDIKPIYIKADVDKKTNIQMGNSFKNIKKAIDENIDSKAILLTYPTYYGVTIDLEKVIKYAHEKNIIVIIDEAHGAHLGLSSKLPKTALSCGADIVIQSTHKTLPAFTQSSMMHISKNAIENNIVNIDRIEKILKMTETSSPSYILMQSLEIAVDIYERYGKELIEELYKNIINFKNELNHYKINIKNKLKNENYKLEEIEFFNIYNKDDFTKIFISSLEVGLTGYELEEILRKNYNIQVELSNYCGVLMISTIGNDTNDFKKMKNALISIYEESNLKGRKKLNAINYPNISPKIIFNPREAFYKEKINVKIEESIGKICGENIVPYPPGVCIIATGEIIQKEIIDYLKYCKKEGMEISGLKDSKFEYIQVIEN